MDSGTPNVLLLILDSTRARNTNLYGYHRRTTPFLEQFAESATIYEQARAPAGRSLPSHASIFTGYLPQEHGLHTIDEKLATDTSIFEELAEQGYETGLFTDNPYLADLDTGLANGFDTIFNNKDLFEEGLSPSAFVEHEGVRYIDFLRESVASDKPLKSLLNGVSWMAKWRFPTLLPQGTVFTKGFTYADQFKEWRSSLDEEQAWAACINLMDTHVPFRPMDTYNKWQTADSEKVYKKADTENVNKTERWKHVLLENRYDGTIRQADAVVESIVTSLDDGGVLDDTLVIVTSDHGEGFGERSPRHDNPIIGHGDGVDEELLHVPLLVKRPNQTSNETVRSPVSLADTPTAIRSVIAGGSCREPYLTDDEVMAGGREDGADVDVLYSPHDGGVKKFVRAASGSITVCIPAMTAAYQVSDSIPDSVEKRMEELSTESVTETTDSELSKATEKQLTALGYTE